MMKTYRLEYLIKVDHPEKRDASYAPVKAGSTVSFSEDMSYPTAVRYFNAMRAGEWDFGSEFIGRVAVVVRERPDCSGRWVRKAIRRTERTDDWRHE